MRSSLFLTGFLLLIGCADIPPPNTQPETNSEDSSSGQNHSLRANREQARAIGLSIIQSYFDNQPEVFVALIADTLPQIGREGDPMEGEYFKELVAYREPYPAGEDFTEFSMKHNFKLCF